MLVSGLLFFFFFTKNIYSTNAWEMNESKANRQRWRAEGEGREQGGAGWTPQDRGPGLECSRRLTTADRSYQILPKAYFVHFVCFSLFDYFRILIITSFALSKLELVSSIDDAMVSLFHM